MGEINHNNERTHTFLVLKTDRGYFQDAWEEYDDVENFCFTDELEGAYQFIGGLEPPWGNAPKYLWDDNKGKAIYNLKQAQEYFGGEVIEVTYTTVTTEKYEWK